MPEEAPRSLTRQQTADLVALLLEANGFPAGTMELPAENEALQLIRLVPAEPGRD